MDVVRVPPDDSLTVLIDRAWAFIERRFLWLILLFLPLDALTFLISEATPEDPVGREWLLVFGGMVVGFLLSSLNFIGAAATIEGSRKGQELKPWQAWGRMLATAPRMTWTHVLVTLVLAPLYLLLIVPGFVGAVYLAFTPLSVYFMKLGGFSALRHSRALTRNRWWSTFFTFLVFNLPSLLVLVIFEMLPEQPAIQWAGVLFGTMTGSFAYVGPVLMFLAREPAALPWTPPAILEPAPAADAPAPIPEEKLSAEGEPVAEPVAEDERATETVPVAVAVPEPASRPPDADTEAFHRLEHDRWELVSGPYHDAFASLTQQAIPTLLDAVQCGPDVRLLDVACGPGYAAAAAASLGARPVGVDFASSMVRAAQNRYRALEFREADAADLPFETARFDAVVINFGMLHFAEPEKALSEAHRVLVPGGRVAFTVWDRPEEAVAFSIVIEAVRKGGNLEVPLPAGPPFFRFSDSSEAIGALMRSGFSAPSAQRLMLVWRLPSPESLFEAMLHATARTGAMLRAQSPQALVAIRDEVTRQAARYVRRDHVELPMPCVLSSGLKA